jgi:hypothetical protein
MVDQKVRRQGRGVRLCFKDDHELNAAEWIVYDALHEYCREMIKRRKPEGQFTH